VAYKRSLAGSAGWRGLLAYLDVGAVRTCPIGRLERAPPTYLAGGAGRTCPIGRLERASPGHLEGGAVRTCPIRRLERAPPTGPNKNTSASPQGGRDGSIAPDTVTPRLSRTA